MNEGHIALDRFGLGKRFWEPLPGEPKAWLHDQLDRYDPVLPGADGLAGRAAIVADIAEYREKVLAGRLPGRKADPSSAGNTPNGSDKSERMELRRFNRSQYIAQVGVRTRGAAASDTPFAEALVHFWANHFAVSADKLVTIAFAGLLEFEAIRPHLLGRFEDMLLAVEQHPAMLLYLDQVQSVGPNSTIGLRARQRGRKVGINENLGREALELHTLGVRTGYTQADVTEFARALTGWTVAGLGRGRLAQFLAQGKQPGQFLFAEPLHEPGARTIMGKTYRQAGEGQARAVLADLARHPATARHIATKLVRHFVADDPPAAVVARLEKAYLASDGHLPTVYRALIDSPEAWAPAPAKFRTPWSWMVALLRGLTAKGAQPAANIPDRLLAGIFIELGQPVWRPGSPAGFDDVAASWAAPDALYRRVELADRIARQVPAGADPRLLANALFGADLSSATREAIARAESPQQGLALLLVAPEMLRC